MSDNQAALDLWLSTSELVPEIYKLANDPNNQLLAKKVGALSLSKSNTASKRLAQEARARNAIGLNAEVISPAKVADLTMHRLDLSGVQCALYLPDDGRVNPLTLLAYSARQASQHGCTLFGGADIIKCLKVPVSGLKGASSKRKSEFIWRLSSSVGVDILASSLIFAKGPVINANRRIYAISYRLELPEEFPLFWDSAPFTYYDYRSGDGFLTVTGGKYGNADQAANDARFHQSMMKAAQGWMPALREMEPSHKWAVNLEVMADTMPQIIQKSKNPIAFSIEGLGALGVLPGMVLGDRVGKTLAVMYQSDGGKEWPKI